MAKLKCPACDEVKCKGCKCRCHEIIRMYNDVMGKRWMRRIRYENKEI